MSTPIRAVAGGGTASKSPPFVLPIRYMTFGIICFGLFAIDLALQAGNLALGNPGVPTLVAVTHLLTLGSLLSFVMGAVYQLSTVAFLMPLSNVRAARFNFWLYTAAFVGLWISMNQWWEPGLLWFGLLMVTAIYVYATVMLMSLWRAKTKDAMWGFIISAHGYLILAVSDAILLVLVDSGTTPALTDWTNALIATHILLFIGGFFTLLVMGFSYKLLPMFTLSHGFGTSRYKWTLILAHVAIVSVLIGIWSPYSIFSYIGLVIGAGAITNQFIALTDIVRHRMRKRIEPPIRAVLSASIAGVLGLALFFTVILNDRGQAGWQSVVTLYLLGLVTFTIIGYAYKIVPFLIWSKRYSTHQGPEKTPVIADLIDVRQSRPVFIGFGLGVVALTLGGLFLWLPATFAGSVLIALSILVFCIQMFHVLNLQKLKKELIEHD